MALNWLCFGLLAPFRPLASVRGRLGPVRGWSRRSGLLRPESRRRSPGSRPPDNPVSWVAGTCGRPSWLRRRTTAARSCGARRQAIPAPLPAPPPAGFATAHDAASARTRGTTATPRFFRPAPWWEPDRPPPSCGYAAPFPTRACPVRSERVMASNCTAASPTTSWGWKRAVTSRCRRRKSCGSSPRACNFRSISGGARPRRRAFKAARRFPALVLEPVDFWALRRLAASRAGLKKASRYLRVQP